MKKLNGNQQGFTIIELLIATMVFSMILLLCAIAIVQVGKMYYKGITMSRTQGVSRVLMDDITQAIQFGTGGTGTFVTIGGPVTKTLGTLSVDVHVLCIGSVRYSYVLNLQAADEVKHVLWKDRMGPADICEPLNMLEDQPSPNGEEFMGDHMRITKLGISNTGNLFSTNLTISYGSADLFTNSTVPADPDYLSVCKSEQGSQFCTVSTLNTSVAKRL